MVYRNTHHSICLFWTYCFRTETAHGAVKFTSQHAPVLYLLFQDWHSSWYTEMHITACASFVHFVSDVSGPHLLVVVAFSSHARILGECSTFYSPPALFFFKVETSLHTLSPLFRPGSVHIGSASWEDCDRVFPDELHVSSFPDRFLHSAWTAA